MILYGLALVNTGALIILIRFLAYTMLSWEGALRKPIRNVFQPLY